MKIVYFGYPNNDHEAPHQAMAAFHMARNKHEVDYICWGGEQPVERSANGFNYLPQPKSGIGSAFLLLFKLFSLLVGHHEYEVVYVQGAQQTPFLFWLPFLKGKKRIIYHTQDYLEPRRHTFYERFERHFAKHADYVVCNEINRGRFMHSYYGLRHQPVIIQTALPRWWKIPARNTEKRHQLIESLNMQNMENVRIIVAGGPYRDDRMSPQVLDAFAQLPENYVLVFNGDSMLEQKGGRKACEQRMKELGLGKRVVFLGGMTYAQLLELYTACDIGVLLYPNDGVGHFYQCPGRWTEYMRCGLSILTCNYPGLELLMLKYRHLGRVCDPETPKSIADALLKIGDTHAENREEILITANHTFVYEHDAAVFEALLSGEYNPTKPSVLT